MEFHELRPGQTVKITQTLRDPFTKKPWEHVSTGKVVALDERSVTTVGGGITGLASSTRAVTYRAAITSIERK